MWKDSEGQGGKESEKGRQRERKYWGKRLRRWLGGEGTGEGRGGN